MTGGRLTPIERLAYRLDQFSAVPDMVAQETLFDGKPTV
jgi:hypothetical protein